MGAAAVPLAIGGIGLQALGTLSSGIASSRESTYQAQVAQNNATIARQNAEYSAAAGVAQAENVGLEAANRLGQVKAAQGANNIDVNSGSAKTVQESERESGELSEANTEQNAILQAYGYQTQATGYQAQAGLERYASAQAVPGSVLSAGGSLLSNAPLLPAKYAAFASPGGGLPSGLSSDEEQGFF